MKYLLIIMILYSPVIIGQEWIIDETTGCKVQNPFPRKHESVTWSGSCIGGIANGNGTLIWKLHGIQSSCKYVGNLENGLPNGQGKYTIDKNLEYSGEFKNGKLNGKGYKISGEYRYEGEFTEDELNGNGKLYKNGKLRYEGEFVNSIENGNGKLFEDDGSIFEGIIEKGYYKKGKLTSIKGYVIEGDWRGYELIFGTFPYSDGKVYYGHMKNWKPNGQGKMTYPNGDIQEGIWKNGRLLK